MTVVDYRDLLDLMYDGVEHRKHRAEKTDPDAVVVYWAIIDKLVRTLPDAEADRLMDARIANMEASLDRADAIIDEIEARR